MLWKLKNKYLASAELKGYTQTEISKTRIDLRILEFSLISKIDRLNIKIKAAAGGERVLRYMCYRGMCGPKGYGFSAVLVINWVSIIAILPPLW